MLCYADIYYSINFPVINKENAEQELLLLDILKSGGLIHSYCFGFFNWSKAFCRVNVFFNKCLNKAQIPEEHEGN